MTTHCLHAIEGRARVRTPGIKGFPRRARDLEQRLRSCRGVRSVKANPTTGNALILYEEAVVSLDDIRDAIRAWVLEQGLVGDGNVTAPNPGSLGGKVVGVLWTAATEVALKRLLLA